MHRGELWWANLPQPVGPRPVILISRDRAIQVRDAVTVAQVTSTIRKIPVEVEVGQDEGLDHASVINCDVLLTIPKGLLTKRLGLISAAKRREVDEALRFALGL